jgi:hypothetical protein
LGRLYTVLGQPEKAQIEFGKTKELHKKTEDLLVERVSGPEPAASPK